MNKIIEGAKEALAVAKGEKPAASTYSTHGPVCPYCQRQYPCDEPHYFDESNYTSETCDECGNEFSVEVHTIVSWSCEPID